MPKKSVKSPPAPPDQSYKILRNVHEQQGELLWLEQESLVVGRDHMLMPMGRAWLLEFIFLRKGSIRFRQNGRAISPPGKSFAVFYAPFSITDVEMNHPHVNWVGVAGWSEMAETEPMIFPVRAAERPRNAQAAMELFRRRRSAVNIGCAARAPRLAQQAKALLAQGYLSGSPVAGVAKKLGVSHEHMSRTFKNAYGLTPLEYLHRLRMNDSYYLLSMGQRIVDVSLDVGYKDLSRFYKQFRKVARMPPGSCQQKYLSTSKNAKT
jgi:AraC-like DNA-binding protein